MMDSSLGDHSKDGGRRMEEVHQVKCSTHATQFTKSAYKYRRTYYVSTLDGWLLFPLITPTSSVWAKRGFLAEVARPFSRLIREPSNCLPSTIRIPASDLDQPLSTLRYLTARTARCLFYYIDYRHICFHFPTAG